MTNPWHPLPDEVVAALRRRRAIEAVRLLLESRRVGLREAFAVIARSARAMERERAGYASAALSGPVREALARGDRTEAIRRIRQETGLGLREAKAAVESQPTAGLRHGPKLAPGEIPRSAASTWILVALAAGAIGYLLLR